jgi:anti-sigma B factor antagonist
VGENGSFGVSLDSYEDVPVVRVAGEIDLATIAPLERTLMRAISISSHTVIDLTQCSFIDSSGIGTILRAQRLLRTRVGDDPALCIVTADPGLIRTLERIGIDQLATIHADIDSAVASADAVPLWEMDRA